MMRIRFCKNECVIFIFIYLSVSDDILAITQGIQKQKAISMIKTELITHIPFEFQRGINRKQASSIVGVSPTTFDRLIKSGQMPPPSLIFGRRIWDKQSIEDACNLLFGRSPQTDNLNPWDGLLN